MSMHDDIKTVLVSEEQLKAKVAELGAQISRDYAGKNLVLVSWTLKKHWLKLKVISKKRSNCFAKKVWLKQLRKLTVLQLKV